MSKLKNKLTRQFIKGIAKEGKDILIQAYDEFVEKLLEDKSKEEKQIFPKKISQTEKWELMRSIDSTFEIHKSPSGYYYAASTHLKDFAYASSPENALEDAWKYFTNPLGVVIGILTYQFKNGKFLNISPIKEKPKSWEENVAQF